MKKSGGKSFKTRPRFARGVTLKVTLFQPLTPQKLSLPAQLPAIN